jgi:hypothetical protein
MASKAGSSGGYFFITSQCRDPTNWTKEIKIGSNSAEHNIDVENGSTLPYDITVQTDLPHTGDIEFLYRGGAASSAWQADVAQLASYDTDKDVAVINCIATRQGRVRINTPTVQYREDSTQAWSSDKTDPFLTIEMEINP